MSRAKPEKTRFLFGRGGETDCSGSSPDRYALRRKWRKTPGAAGRGGRCARQWPIRTSFVIGKPFFPEDFPVPVVRCSGSGFLKASASGIDDICMHRESRGGADGFPNERMRQMESRIRSSGIRDRLMKSASGFSRRRKSRDISFSAMASGGTKKVVRLGCR